MRKLPVSMASIMLATFTIIRGYPLALAWSFNSAMNTSDAQDFSYQGCFKHLAGGDVGGNFLEVMEIGVDSAEECFKYCKGTGFNYFCISDSDCPDRGKQADCQCGDSLPTEKYAADECANCIDKNGKEYHYSCFDITDYLEHPHNSSLVLLHVSLPQQEIHWKERH